MSLFPEEKLSVVVRNIMKQDITEQEIRQAFDVDGCLGQIKLRRDPSLPDRSLADLTYQHQNCADHALEFHGAVIFEGEIGVSRKIDFGGSFGGGGSGGKGGLFGGSPQKAEGGGLFGGGGGGGLFGGSPQKAEGGLFGGGGSGGGGGLFGGSPQKAEGGGLFGGSSQKAEGGGLFQGLNLGSGGLFSGQKTNMFAGLGEKSNKANEKSPAQSMLESWFATKKFADVICDVQGEEILAHKAVLAERSKYLEQLLSTAAPQQTGLTRITIPDAHPAAFKALLEYLYCDTIKANEDLGAQLLQLSDKYTLPDLKTKCETTLASLLSLENFAKIAKNTEEHQTPKLRDALLEFTTRNCGNVAQKEEELNEVPQSILVDMIEKLAVSKSA